VSRPWRCTIPYFRKRFPGVGLIVALSVLLVPLLSGLMSATAASPTEYGLIVRVIGPDANGNMVPLTNAVVRISGGSSTLSHVNANGEAALTTTVPAGEYATVTAILDGYRTTRLQYLISANSATRALPSSPSGKLINSLTSLCGLVGLKTPVVTLTLVPGDDPAGELVPLKIEVRNENDTPVAGASVKILASDGQEVTSSPTGATGLTGSMDLERSTIEAGLRAFVTSPDGRHVTNTISTSVLNGPGQRYFLVILSNDPATNGERSTQGVAVAACTESPPATTKPATPVPPTTTTAAPAAPTKVMLTVDGDVCTDLLIPDAPAQTCSGGYEQYSNWYLKVPDAAVTVTASVNAPLPPGDSLQINGSPTPLCVVKPPGESCTATIQPNTNAPQDVGVSYVTASGGGGPAIALIFTP
jgi:hypothetical protein